MKAQYIIWIGALLVCAARGSYAQGAGAPGAGRDTTYTVYSTYKKLVKQYPAMVPVRAAPSAAVTERRHVAYALVNDSLSARRWLYADVFMPSRAGTFPAVILVHGGGWRSGDKEMNTPMAQQLAARGFVVASVEYRLSQEAKYPAAVYDLKAAVRWLRQNAAVYNADSAHIAIAGCSAGGQLASLVGTTHGLAKFEGPASTTVSSSVQAVVDMDGVLDFTHAQSLAVKRTENSADVYWLGGFYSDIPQRWKDASAITWVGAATPPFLFINSSQSRFHAGCSEMAAQLQRLGIYHDVKTLDGAPHSYWLFHPWFEPTVQHIVNFLQPVFNSN